MPHATNANPTIIAPSPAVPPSDRRSGRARTPHTPASSLGHEASDNRSKKNEFVLKPRPNQPQARERLSDNYEAPISGREGWWRTNIRETPNPGSYEPDSFLKDIKARPNTYRFKSDGRKIDPQPQIGKGAILLPGAYEHDTFKKRVDDLNITYAFKNTDRQSRGDILNFGKKDKDINVPPNAYGTEKYLTLTVDKQPTKHWVFRSASRRFPTPNFKPKEGPPPGNYEYLPPGHRHTVNSSFKSKTPRFNSSHTKFPGPGTYDGAVQCPMPETIAKMGRQSGIFFTSAFHQQG